MDFQEQKLLIQAEILKSLAKNRKSCKICLQVSIDNIRHPAMNLAVIVQDLAKFIPFSYSLVSFSDGILEIKNLRREN